MKTIITAIVAGLMCGSVSLAGTINVPGDYTSIQQAMDAANDGDTIQVAGGVYYEDGLNPGGRSISVVGDTNGDGTPAVTIDAQQNGVVFIFQSGEGPATTIENLIIRGGQSSSGGGGFDCYKNSSPTIRNCVITDNETEYNGGGIWCWSGCEPVITGCTISGNTSDESGGGIYCYLSSPTIIDCTISQNNADWHGGGIHVSGGAITLSGTEVSGNITWNPIAEGCGLWCDDSTVSLESCVITGNEGNDDGGGMFMRACTFSIDHCEVSQNSCGWGGGLFVTQSTGTVFGTAIVGNGVWNQGGALYCGSGSTVELNGCLISGNCGDGGSVSQTIGTTSIGASIVCGNCAAEDCVVPSGGSGQFVDLGGNHFVVDCPVMGACCIGDSCLANRIEMDCLAYGGTWLGENSDCGQCPEPEAAGACCVNGLCAPLTAEDCFNVEGLFAGQGVSCEDAGCPSACPGDVSGDGQVGIVDLLTVIDGWGLCP